MIYLIDFFDEDLNDALIVSINNFPGYEIDTDGNVYGKYGEKMSPELRKGYYSITLTKDDKRYHKPIHRLMAETFILNDKNYPMVDHIDKNPLNNSLNNLRWVTSSMNSRNRKKDSRNTSGTTGVYYHKRDHIYSINIMHNGKRIQKSFKNEEDAIIYRRRLELQYGYENN